MTTCKLVFFHCTWELPLVTARDEPVQTREKFCRGLASCLLCEWPVARLFGDDAQLFSSHTR